MEIYQLKKKVILFDFRGNSDVNLVKAQKGSKKEISDLIKYELYSLYSRRRYVFTDSLITVSPFL